MGLAPDDWQRGLGPMTTLVTLGEARAQGLKRYFTGKPCKRGHVAERFTLNMTCVECHGAWIKANPEKLRATDRAWTEANRDKKRLTDRRARAKEYITPLNATPVWADLSAIAAVYAEASRLTRETGVPHHVDHIVPLRSPRVCELHIAGNLRPLPASENCAKGNRHWPGMWE